MVKKVLVIGASGQAGSYLVEKLKKLGHEVDGTYYSQKVEYRKGMYQLDVKDDLNTRLAFSRRKYDVVYNMASLMYAPASWDRPLEYAEVNYMGTARILRYLFLSNPEARYFQAGSAEVFNTKFFPQSEETPKCPRNPYGVAKMAAQELTRVYRERGHFACTGIFFNMESPRREETFFSRKVTKGLVDILLGRTKKKLKLGRLSAIRDWGLTEEFMEVPILMTEQEKPQDYVIGTGEKHTCLEFVQSAVKQAQVPMDVVEYEKVVAVGDADIIWSNPEKVERDLGWKAKSKMTEVIRELLKAEIERG